MATSPELEILDLRHFSSPALRPLLEEEAAKWERRLTWDYRRSIELLLDYVNHRSLTGYVAVRRGRVAGYGFGVCEAAKAVLGDVYAYGEGEQESNPVCEVLLDHIIELLQATPGIDRIEAQLLLFPVHALQRSFISQGFRAFPRCFMTRQLQPDQDVPRTLSKSQAALIERWQPEFYLPAALLIQEAYLGHTDSDINDQYRTAQGAQRFLHNIVHFPGCGVFDANNSWAVRNQHTGEIDGVLLCSRIRSDAAHITQLCVRSSARGFGFGNALLSHCLWHLQHSGLRTVSLTVTASNTQAVNLYVRQGFHVQHSFEAWVWNR